MTDTPTEPTWQTIQGAEPGWDELQELEPTWEELTQENDDATDPEDIISVPHAYTTYYELPLYIDSEKAEFGSQTGAVSEKIDTILGERLLKLVEHGSNVSATTGQLIKCGASITVSLPAPSLNDIVGVTAASGRSEITVDSGSHRIFGPWWDNLETVYISSLQTVIFVSDGTHWYVVGQPAMAYAPITASTWQAEIGELVACSGASTCTVTAPSASAGGEFAVFAGSGTTVTVSGGTFYGDVLEGASSLTLLGDMHVTLRSDGTNWLVVSGQPKNPHTFTTETSVGEAELTPSVKRPSTLVFNFENATETHQTVEVLVSGTKVAELAEIPGAGTGMGTLLLEPGDSYCIRAGGGDRIHVYTSYRLR